MLPASRNTPKPCKPRTTTPRLHPRRPVRPGTPPLERRVKLRILQGVAVVTLVHLSALTGYGLVVTPALLTDALTIHTYLLAILVLWAVGPQLRTTMVALAVMLAQRGQQSPGRPSCPLHPSM